MHLLGNGGQSGQNTSGNLNAVADGLDVVEKGLDTLLQILVVGCRQALDGAHQTGHLAEGTAGLTTKQLEGIYEIGALVN